MYYPCSENKDADQLRGYREADLRLCFRPCKLLVFSRTGSYKIIYMYFLHLYNDVLQFAVIHVIHCSLTTKSTI